MKNLIKLEELFFVLISVVLFRSLDYAWPWFLVLFLAPDLGMIGYLVGTRVGAITYNVTHHKAVAISAYIAGAIFGVGIMQLAGLIILAHSSFDRVLGYGLKHPDSFKHTHLGMIGASSRS